MTATNNFSIYTDKTFMAETKMSSQKDLGSSKYIYLPFQQKINVIAMKTQ
jgi:hypothetical protein